MKNKSAFKTVRAEALEAYADAHPVEQSNANARRNLNWRASAAVSPAEAISIMEETCPSYNEFTPELLKQLPSDAKVTLAREGSVCIYVDKVGDATVGNLKADEFDNDGANVRIWWD